MAHPLAPSSLIPVNMLIANIPVLARLSTVLQQMPSLASSINQLSQPQLSWGFSIIREMYAKIRSAQTMHRLYL